MTVVHPTRAALDKGVTPLCSEIDINLYFPDKGQTLEHDAAKALCFTCPVQAECLEWSLHHEDYGVWGGYNGSERAEMRAERGITLHAPETAVMNAYFEDRAEEGIRDETSWRLEPGWFDFTQSPKWAGAGLTWMERD